MYVPINGDKLLLVGRWNAAIFVTLFFVIRTSFEKKRQFHRMQKPIDSSSIRVALVEDDMNFQQVLRDNITNAGDIVLVSVASTRAQGLKAGGGHGKNAVQGCGDGAP